MSVPIEFDDVPSLVKRLWDLEQEEIKILEKLEFLGFEMDGMDDKELRLIFTSKNPYYKKKKKKIK